jgi:hypothetical protein
VPHAALRIFTIALLAAAMAACAGDDSASTRPQKGSTAMEAAKSSTLPRGSEPFELDPAEFKSGIDNPYWPIAPGSHWVYRETDSEGAVARVDVTVTTKTKTIMGIDAAVVHDRVTEDRQIKEDTFDWYAQDQAGNLWYLGEDTKEYENGKVKTTEGSWEAGVDGALGGIIIPAEPKQGLKYREEYYAGYAEDGAEILSLNARAKVPYGTFDHVLQTRNFSPLEPNFIEEKFYARGVGPVLEVAVSGGSDRAVLITFVPGA